MSTSINIQNVALKKSETDYEIIGIMRFLKKPMAERNDLIMKRMVQFLDEKGENIPLTEAMASITNFIKQLREEGKLLEFMAEKEG